jgi:HSP20 family protein
MHRQGPEEVGMSIMGFEPFRDFDRLTSQLVSGRRVPHGVALDAWRSGDAYRVALDLPGVDPERIELICERNGLTIRAERAADYGEQDEVLIAGRPVGTFTRQLILGDELDTQAIRADYRNGVLHVTIPVAATAQPRRIQVTQTAEPAGQPKTIDVADADPKPTAAPPRD